MNRLRIAKKHKWWENENEDLKSIKESIKNLNQDVVDASISETMNENQWLEVVESIEELRFKVAEEFLKSPKKRS
jgi:hypothetical protein